MTLFDDTTTLATCPPGVASARPVAPDPGNGDETGPVALRGEAQPAGPDLTFIAHGTPGPQGSKTGYAINGRVVMRESSKKVRPWRQDVRDAALRALPDDWTPLDGPLAVDMVFTLRKPVSAPKRRRTWPDRTPDLSKLCRATEDAMTGVVWRDDARVVEYRTLAKRYPLEGDDALTYPGVIVRIYRISDPPAATSPAAGHTGR